MREGAADRARMDHASTGPPPLPVRLANNREYWMSRPAQGWIVGARGCGTQLYRLSPNPVASPR